MATHQPNNEPDYQLDEPDKSLGDLISRLTSDMGDLVTAHIDLAKVEIKDEVAKTVKSVGMLGAAAFAGLVAVFVLSGAAAWGLAELMATGLAFLIVGLVWTAAAGILALMGRKKMSSIDPKPTETMNQIKEDKQWLKNEVR